MSPLRFDGSLSVSRVRDGQQRRARRWKGSDGQRAYCSRNDLGLRRRVWSLDHPAGLVLLRHGRLPGFTGLIEAFGGPWSSRLQPVPFVVLLMAFLLLTVTVTWDAWKVWNGSKAGAVIARVVLPVEADFWVGFALPIPSLVGTARVALLALAWNSPANRLETPRMDGRILRSSCCLGMHPECGQPPRRRTTAVIPPL